MELKEFKRLIQYARKRGVKSLRIDNFEVHFSESSHAMPPIPRRTKAVQAPAQERLIPAPDPGPTLQQINDWIYSEKEELA